MVRPSRNMCSVRGGRSDLILQDGRITVCGKVMPEYDMYVINVDDVRTITDYEILKDKKLNFREKTYNTTCSECDVNDICCRCPKFINVSKIQIGHSDTCVFYKTMLKYLPKAFYPDMSKFPGNNIG